MRICFEIDREIYNDLLALQTQFAMRCRHQGRTKCPDCHALVKDCDCMDRTAQELMYRILLYMVMTGQGFDLTKPTFKAVV